MTDQTSGIQPESAEGKLNFEGGAQIGIQRIYAKDVSFEAPNLPELYQLEYKPQIKMDLSSKSRQVGEGLFEVVLQLTLTATLEEKTAFLAEIQQAGLFNIKGMDEATMRRTLATFCPEMIYPYAREAVTNLVSRGGFPQVLIAPVNFDRLFEEQMGQAAESAIDDLTSPSSEHPSSSF